ncbi:hypothetical protein [Vibrio sp. SCSIO 43136]|uniref:hypothetical protein n=1 Tax=Vibrio sp. SCSIO 43136 TaxID=2819101 RepID=UPI002075B64A|nr:hypothetical protein [Vibrio sp. SCSIO 43136]USD65847.1 hypothetical protein J4N39_03210 [Vibrio sp. SCSIO 43136]
MKKFSGYATLTVTVLLLGCMLLITIASHQHTLFQLKRYKNQEVARQQAWLAEGGLECFYAQARDLEAMPASIHDCGAQQSPSIVVSSVGGNEYQVTASSGYQHVSRNLVIGGSGSGVLQANSSLYFHSAFTVSTPDPGNLASDGWQCTSITYSGDLVLNSTFNNQGVIHGLAPSSQFNSQGKDCASDHRTINSSNYQKDIRQAKNMEPFESFFGVKASQHNSIRDGGEFTVLTGSGTPKILADCGSTIADSIKAGSTRIWVEGGCEITSEQYNALVDASHDTTNGVLLLLHDGPVSLMGAPAENASSNKFKGALMVFHHNYEPKLSDWENMKAGHFLSHATSDFPIAVRQQAGFYQHGSFFFTGGMFIDMASLQALFYTSLNLSYNQDVINSVFNPFSKPVWKAGSWRDF